MNLLADNIKDFGITEDIICPRCKATVYMNILKASNGIGFLGFKLYDFKIDLFTICPECNALYSVDSEIAKRAGKERSNNYTMINEGNITFVRDLK
ncbi:MAG: hypothetical protein GX241_04820 [Ruminococcaceae bacterium]|nr:hypothetical protein [Oscillospiraceae bacterium]